MRDAPLHGEIKVLKERNDGNNNNNMDYLFDDDAKENNV